jgi:hypothetical protein
MAVSQRATVSWSNIYVIKFLMCYLAEDSVLSFPIHVYIFLLNRKHKFVYDVIRMMNTANLCCSQVTRAVYVIV